MIKRVCAAVCLGVVPVTAFAANLYDCTMRDAGAVGNWIQPEILILHEPDAEDARVTDGIVQTYSGKKDIAARVVTENDKRVTFAWDVMISQSGQNANMGYRLTYLKATGTAMVTAQAAGYIGPFTSQGQCTLKQVK